MPSHPLGLTSQNGRSSSHYRSLYNAVAEQVVGIAPARAVGRMNDATQPMFRSGLLSDGMFSSLRSAMMSVAATSSGDGALALERAADCFDQAAQLQDQSDALGTRCFTASSGPLIALETAYASIVQQGVGYLPPNVMTGLINSASCFDASLTRSVGSFYMSRSKAVPGEPLRTHVLSAMQSFEGSLSGEGSTLGIELISGCLNNLLAFHTAPKTLTCAFDVRVRRVTGLTG